MILMNIKLDNFILFNDFELCTSYPKKIVDSGIGEECLKNHPNFRYKKLVILMGANATGKTAFGRILMTIFNFISRKEYSRLISLIEDNSKEASFSIDFVHDDKELWRIETTIEPSPRNEYRSENIAVKVKSVPILSNDNYERCVKRLEAEDYIENSNYIKILELMPRFTWGFEFPYEMDEPMYIGNDNGLFHKVLKKILKTLDPRIIDVKRLDEEITSVSYPHCSVTIKNGKLLENNILSKGTAEGIGIALLIASMKIGRADFYYCDEKFSHIHSDAEKAFLSLLIDLLGYNQQMFITTHNMDILDMDIPKHSFAFLRRDEDNDNNISCIFASEYLKKNTDSIRNAVENDVFSSSPDITGIYEVRDI